MTSMIQDVSARAVPSGHMDSGVQGMGTTLPSRQEKPVGQRIEMVAFMTDLGFVGWGPFGMSVKGTTGQ